MKRHTTRAWLAVTLLSLTLAGCASSATSKASAPTAAPTTTPSPTVAPLAAPPVHQLALSGVKVGMVFPGAAGLVLSSAVFPAGQTTQSLSLYSYSAQSTQQIATAPALMSIVQAVYGGDWVSYVVANAKLSNWAIWTYNVSTRKRIQVGSASQEGNVAPWAMSLQATDTDLAWVTQYPVASNGPAEADSKLFDFTYATGKTQILYTAKLTLLAADAMNGAAILLSANDEQTGTGATYLLKRGASAPQQISTQIARNAAMNERYAVWDDPQANMLTLYDLTTGAATSNWAECYQPAISATAPYVMCSQTATGANLLVRTPDGVFAALGGSGAPATTAMAPDAVYQTRAYFVTSSGGVDYIDLPAE